jgi:hypothetical protein
LKNDTVWLIVGLVGENVKRAIVGPVAENRQGELDVTSRGLRERESVSFETV